MNIKIQMTRGQWLAIGKTADWLNPKEKIMEQPAADLTTDLINETEEMADILRAIQKGLSINRGYIRHRTERILLKLETIEQTGLGITPTTKRFSEIAYDIQSLADGKQDETITIQGLVERLEEVRTELEAEKGSPAGPGDEQKQWFGTK